MRRVWKATVKRIYSYGGQPVFTAELVGADGTRDVTFALADIHPIDRPRIVVGAGFDWVVERDDDAHTTTEAIFERTEHGHL